MKCKLASRLAPLLPLAATCFAVAPLAQAQMTEQRVLIVYDAPSGTPYAKLGSAYSIMLQNLLGHFDTVVDAIPAQSYTAGKLNNYQATFYIGAVYDNPLPAALLTDVSTTTQNVVWFRYNIWELAWDAQYNFNAKTGLNFVGLRSMNATPSPASPAPGFFDTVSYKGLDFQKYYKYDSGTNAIAADPDVGVMQVVDPAKASSFIPIKNSKTGEIIPYVARSGNFWYFADMPFSYIGPRDRYLVFADVLHDILGVTHAENHQAMVRLEDVDATVNPANMRKLGDFLATKSIPYSVATIPEYVDPFGKYNGGIPEKIPFSQATALRNTLNYALTKRGEIVQHGYTHQSGNRINANSGVSGDDFEFWDASNNTPMAEETATNNWGANRITTGRRDLLAYGYTPVAWEFPHYQASATSMRAVAPLYAKTYQRQVYYTADVPKLNGGGDYAVGQFFPYVIKKDYYGQKVLPENLGNFEYDLSWIDPNATLVYTWQDIVLNAKYAYAVRDGFASFFFHPFLLEPSLNLPALQDFKNAVNGINNMGYRWTSPSRLP